MRCGRVGLILFCSLLSLLCFSTGAALAHPITAPDDGIEFQQLDVGPGFQMNPSGRRGFWLPAFATVSNDGRSSFSGSLVVRIYNGFPHSANQGFIPSPQSFSTPVTLAPGTQKRFSVDVPFNTGPFTPQGIMADLLDSHGKTLKSLNKDVTAANESDISVGVLSNHVFDFLNGPLNNLSLPNQANTVDVLPLTANTFPTQATVLENFEVIILDDFSTDTLNSDQLSALQTWVNQGGALIEVGGPEWQRTLSKLPSDLRPVDINGTIEFPAGTHLLPTSGFIPNASDPSDTLSTPITVSAATMRPSENTGTAFTQTAIMASEMVPMLLQTHQGQGVICYLAFDPGAAPITTWPGLKMLWTHLLARVLSNQLLISPQAQRYSSGPGALLARGGMVSSLEPSVGIPLWIFAVLLFGYIALLGPLRLIFTRRAKRPFWNWRIVVSSIVIFSLISYGAAFYQKGAALTDNSISLIDFNQSGSTGHVTTYMGVFVPSQDNFKIHLPGTSLVQTITDPLFSANSGVTEDDTMTPVNYMANGTDITLLNAGMWTFHPLVYEQDHQFQGNLHTQLTLHGNRLVGIVKNTLPTPLSDAYVLLPHSFVALGTVPAGGTVKVNQALQSLNITTPLADQIAESNHLPAPYFPYGNHGQPKTDTQRHIAELEAFNGAGNTFAGCSGSCNTSAIVRPGKNSIIVPALALPRAPLTSNDDPLLINGTQATLVGWADQAIDGANDTTVNGLHTHGYHDNLLRMPLSVNLATPFDLSPNLISGNVVDTQGNDIEMVMPGVYALSTGMVSFEFSLPNIENGNDIGTAQIKTLNISIPNTLNGSQPPAPDISYIQAQLYNWQSATWDKISLSHNTLTLSRPNMYIGPDARVLLQLSNQKTNQPPVYFSRPSITLS